MAASIKGNKMAVPILSVLFATVLLLLQAIIIPDTAEAIPAFARANKVPCTTCHVQFPKLNAFGIDFKQNGYRMKGKRGKFIWTKDNLPVAAMTALMANDMKMKMTGMSGITETKTRSAMRRELALFSAGSVGPKASYFFDFSFEETTVTTPSGTEEISTAAPDRTFVIFNDLLPESTLNLKAGVMKNEFMNLSDPRKTTMSAYIAPVTLDHTGVELNGVKSGLRWAAGFGNDERVGTSGVNNNLRGGYGWAAYTVAGQTIGTRYYAAEAGGSLSNETHTQWDANVDLSFKSANLILAYYAQDNVIGGRNDKKDNLLAELIYPATSKLLLTARYEAQNTEVGGVKVADNDQQVVLSSSYYFLPNMSLALEYTRLDGNEKVARNGGSMPMTMEMDMYMAGFHVAF